MGDDPEELVYDIVIEDADSGTYTLENGILTVYPSPTRENPALPRTAQGAEGTERAGQDQHGQAEGESPIGTPGKTPPTRQEQPTSDLENV